LTAVYIRLKLSGRVRRPKEMMKKVAREIDAAGVALFSRRVSYDRVEREMARYCPRGGKPELDIEAEPARFQAVGELFLLMQVVRNMDGDIAKLRRDVRERAARVRKLVGVATKAA
jgi:hypothetical protein